MKSKTTLALFDPALVQPAVRAAFAKLSPQAQWRNPVMFVVYVGSILTTLLGLQALQGQQHSYFCGAWTGYGFHEDGLKSGLDVAARLRPLLG